MAEFFGKYRATVVDIADPTKSGKIKVQCPKVIGEGKSGWALPCLPFANDTGGTLFMPKVGDLVWVEFEEGDANKPIWVGSFWKDGKNPVTTLTDRLIILDEAGSYIKTEEDGTLTIHATHVIIDADRFDMPQE